MTNLREVKTGMNKYTALALLGVFLLGSTWYQLPDVTGYYVEYNRSCDSGWLVPSINYVTPRDQSDYFERSTNMTCNHLLFLVLFETGLQLFQVSVAVLVIYQFFTKNEIIIRERMLDY